MKQPLPSITLRCDFKVTWQGRSQDFSKGGSHWVKQYRHGVFADGTLWVVCLKKRVTKGGSRAPQDPPPP